MPQANELDLFNASDQAPPMIPTSVTHMDIIVPIKDSPLDISYFDVAHSWLKVLLNLVLSVDVNYFSMFPTDCKIPERNLSIVAPTNHSLFALISSHHCL